MSISPVLSLLGIALRGNNLVVGEEPVEAVAWASVKRRPALARLSTQGVLTRVAP